MYKISSGGSPPNYLAERSFIMTHPAESHHKISNAKSVSKTLAILATFNETTPMQRTSDIAAKLHMNISTVSRHLNTMLDWGFLERDDATGFYYLGLEIVALAGASLQNNDVYRHAFPELQQLSYKYGVHSHMGVPRQVDVVHLISICCENTMELLIPMGHCHPMYCSAMGRALLAYMPADRAQEILKKSELQKYAYQTNVATALRHGWQMRGQTARLCSSSGALLRPFLQYTIKAGNRQEDDEKCNIRMRQDAPQIWKSYKETQKNPPL